MTIVCPTCNSLGYVCSFPAPFSRCAAYEDNEIQWRTSRPLFLVSALVDVLSRGEGGGERTRVKTQASEKNESGVVVVMPFTAPNLTRTRSPTRTTTQKIAPPHQCRRKRWIGRLFDPSHQHQRPGCLERDHGRPRRRWRSRHCGNCPGSSFLFFFFFFFFWSMCVCAFSTEMAVCIRNQCRPLPFICPYLSLTTRSRGTGTTATAPSPTCSLSRSTPRVPSRSLRRTWMVMATLTSSPPRSTTIRSLGLKTPTATATLSTPRLSA